MRPTPYRRTTGPRTATGLFGANTSTGSILGCIAALVVISATGGCSPSADPTDTVAPRPSEMLRSTSAASPSTLDSQDFQTGRADSGRPVAVPSRTPTATVPTTTLPPGRKGTPRGAHSGRVDQTDVSAVAKGFMTKLAAIDTRLDNRPNDAARRAAGLATPRLRQELTSGKLIGPPGATFIELQRRSGWTTVTVDLISLDLAPDKPSRVYRAVSATAVPTDGTWSGPAETTTAVLALTRSGSRGSWAVDDYEALI